MWRAGVQPLVRHELAATGRLRRLRQSVAHNFHLITCHAMYSHYAPAAPTLQQSPSSMHRTVTPAHLCRLLPGLPRPDAAALRNTLFDRPTCIAYKHPDHNAIPARTVATAASPQPGYLRGRPLHAFPGHTSRRPTHQGCVHAACRCPRPQVRNVTSSDVRQYLADGWVLLDVRPPSESKKAPIVGAVQVRP